MLAIKRLADASNSSEALCFLYTEHKKIDASFSLAKICESAGIPSRGYLSGVINGSRVLHLKYRNSIAKAFKLRRTEVRFVKTLIDIDNETSLDRVKKLKFRLSVLRKSLCATTPVLSEKLADTPLLAEVFCAFGLFGNSPLEEELVEYFGSRHAAKIETALDALLAHGFISIDGLRYRVNENIIMFKDSEDGFSHISFLQAAMGSAKKDMKHWYNRPDIAHFEASILSVRKSELVRLLPVIKDQLAEARVRFETDKGDTLIRFCCQIYPLGKLDNES